MARSIGASSSPSAVPMASLPSASSCISAKPRSCSPAYTGIVPHSAFVPCQPALSMPLSPWPKNFTALGSSTPPWEPSAARFDIGTDSPPGSPSCWLPSPAWCAPQASGPLRIGRRRPVSPIASASKPIPLPANTSGIKWTACHYRPSSTSNNAWSPPSSAPSRFRCAQWPTTPPTSSPIWTPPTLTANSPNGGTANSAGTTCANSGWP